MRGGNSRPTLSDIAAEAGVSPATVSRVVNKSASVSPSTRSRVEAAMATLGYSRVQQPPAPRKPHGTIGVVISDILNPFFAEVLRGIEDEAGNDGRVVALATSREDLEREQAVLHRLNKLGVDGIITSGSRLDPQFLIDFQERSGIPMVVLNRHIKHPNITCILIDLERSMSRAAQHLITLNHTRIAYLAGPISSDSSRARKRGIETALAEIGHSLRSDWCLPSFPNVEGGFQAMSALLARPADDRPTAVIAYNDMMALGALNAIRAAGLRVPDDISLVGFDDIAMGAHANPPLTTVAQPKYQMGMLAVGMLRQIYRREAIPTEGYVLLESPLVIRESTAPLE